MTTGHLLLAMGIVGLTCLAGLVVLAAGALQAWAADEEARQSRTDPRDYHPRYPTDDAA